MKRKISSYIRDHMQLVVGHQRTIGTLQQDEELKLVQTTLPLKVDTDAACTPQAKQTPTSDLTRPESIFSQKMCEIRERLLQSDT